MSRGAPDHDSLPLIGREEETARLTGLLTTLHEDGEGGALLLDGAPGIGKSALIEHARRQATERDMQLLSAEGAESEIELAYAGLHQLLRPIIRHRGRLPTPQRRALDAAFGIVEAENLDLFHVALAALTLIALAADERPVVLLIDDAHWLDRSTLDVLAFVARRLSGIPAALLGTVRSGHRTALDRVRLPLLTLDRLDDEQSARLLDGLSPGLHPLTRARVLTEAQGNPLALRELSRPLSGSDASAGSLLLAPMTLSERLERRFNAQAETLPAPTRQALLAAALDPQATLTEVVAVVDEVLFADSATPAPAALDPAVTAGLISVQNQRVHFTHPLIRTSVLHSAAPAERRQVLRVLAEKVTDPERRLWHRAQAAIDIDDGLADELDDHSVSVRRRGAPVAALVALERSSELTADPRRRGERLIRAAEVAYELGLFRDMSRLLDSAPTLGLSAAAGARRRWLALMMTGGFWAEAGVTRAFVEIAEQLAAGGEQEAALRSLVPVALRGWWVRSAPRTRRFLADAARAVTPADDDPRLLAVMALADPERLAPEVRQRLASRSSTGDDDPNGDVYLGVAAEDAGDFAQSATRLTHAIAQLRAQGGLVMLTQALVQYAWAAGFTGAWRSAAAAGREAVDLARETRQPHFGLAGQVFAALAIAPVGDEAAVEAQLAGSDEQTLALGGGPLAAPAHLARGAVALADGRHEQAFAHLWAVFDEASPSFHRFMRWPALLDLVEAATGCGRQDEALAVLAHLDPVLHTADPPVLRANVTCALALTAEDDAAAAFHTALSQDLSGYPALRARTLFAYGRWLRRHRRHVLAREPLTAACDQFEALGSARWAQRARQELRAIGQRTTVPLDGEAALTTQERSVVELAAQGLTNREIGERLFLSPRTVGTHLYHAFPKLGVTARSQLRDALDTPRT